MKRECIAYFRDGKSINLDPNKQYIIEVKGWVMLQNVDSGMYRIKPVYVNDFTGFAVDFYKLKGKKRLVRHRLEDLGFMPDNYFDLNGIILKEEYRGNIEV